jgi:hypothetical protein
LNSTPSAPRRPVPVIVISVPAAPVTGVKLFTFDRTLNNDELLAVPPALVTLMRLFVAVVGTIALMEAGESIEKLALTSPNFTDEVPVKFLPDMVTAVPASPLVGVKLSIFGGIIKLVVLTAVPSGVVTLMRPLVASNGIAAKI